MNSNFAESLVNPLPTLLEVFITYLRMKRSEFQAKSQTLSRMEGAKMSLVFMPEQIELFHQPEEGKVEEGIMLNRSGRVKWQGTSWPARSYGVKTQAVISPGEIVKVVGIKGIELLVVPCIDGNPIN